MKITFHGGAGTVTGSRYLVEHDRSSLLVDCGLFQGMKNLRLRNWKKFPFALEKLGGIVLTHAHIDHSGYLPAVVRDGFSGKIHATRATRDLCEFMLPDAGHIQEEDARYANQRSFSKHHPALPLYTEKDAQKSLGHFRAHDFDQAFAVGDFEVRFRIAGHILGAATIEIRGGGRSVLFSGDLGPSNHMIMHAPVAPLEHDLIVMESTYGDRVHSGGDPLDTLERETRTTLERGGVVLIPAFAVGRAQTVLYCLHLLMKAGRIPEVPIFVNSPMASDASELYLKHADLHRLSSGEVTSMFKSARFVQSVDESIALNQKTGPMIIISASGMLTGGRILHHMRAFAPDPKNLILLPGFQAPGTRGAAIAGGAGEVKIHGKYVPVRARVSVLGIFSAHADQAGLIAWLGAAARRPAHVRLVHGEPAAADALRMKIADQLGWEAEVAELGEVLEVA